MSDLISRQADIDAVCKSCSLVGDYHKCDGYPQDSTWCEDALKALPYTQPRKGKWIPHQSKYGIEGEMVYECSYCGENVGFYPHNFCPYCGSYNGGEQE